MTLLQIKILIKFLYYIFTRRQITNSPVNFSNKNPLNLPKASKPQISK